MKKYLEKYFAGGALLCALPLMRIMPECFITHLAYVCAYVLYFTVPSRRSIVRKNLILVYGKSASYREISRLSRRIYFENTFSVVDAFFLLIKKYDRHSVIARMIIDGKCILDRALSRGKGVIAAGCHLSNFVFGVIALSAMGYPMTALARRLDSPIINDIFHRECARRGVELIYTKPQYRAAHMSVAAIRRKRILWTIVDQDYRRKGVFVDFMGLPASTPQGAAVIAARLNVPVITLAVLRARGRHYRVVIGEEIPIEKTGDTECDVAVNTQRITLRVEEHIRKHPEQWWWFHRRWKTKKPADAV